MLNFGWYLWLARFSLFLSITLNFVLNIDLIRNNKPLLELL